MQKNHGTILFLTKKARVPLDCSGKLKKADCNGKFKNPGYDCNRKFKIIDQI
jgi:hypothetical protein